MFYEDEKDKKSELLFLATMVSMFSGFSLKEISYMEQEQVNSYIETFKRALNFAEN